MKSSLSLGIAGLAGLLLLVGCSPQVKSQGKQDTVATYSNLTLRANLPTDARVPAVLSAAEQTLRARGYAIEASSSTEEKGEVIAHPPRTRDWPKITITASRGVSSTVVDLRVKPFGDQELCRSVLDGMLQRLGM
jgi:hypothetical protein